MKIIDADKLLYDELECVDGNTYMVVHAADIDNAEAIDNAPINNWINIKDNLPNNSDDYLVKVPITFYYSGGEVTYEYIRVATYIPGSVVPWVVHGNFSRSKCGEIIAWKYII